MIYEFLNLFFCEGAFKMKTSLGNFPLMVLQKICIRCDRHQTIVVNGICADDLVGTVRIIHGNIFSEITANASGSV